MIVALAPSDHDQVRAIDEAVPAICRLRRPHVHRATAGPRLARGDCDPDVGNGSRRSGIWPMSPAIIDAITRTAAPISVKVERGPGPLRRRVAGYPPQKEQRSLMNEETDKPIELGALLELLQRAGAPLTTVQATYRIWHHDERARAAFQADIEEQKCRGVLIATLGLGEDSSAPAEREELLHIWRSDDRVREQHESGPRDGSYGVRVGELWWMWDQQSGATSNEDDPAVGGIGQEVAVMLNPTPLIGALRFRVLGRSQEAGRATISVEAVPRPFDPRRPPQDFELHQLGGGADRYTIEVDAQRGVLLAATAFRDDEPFRQITTLEIIFDEPIPDETFEFEFEPPAGEAIRTVPPEHIPLTEAQRRAPFTLLVPDRVPSDWQLHCMLVEPSDRPPHPGMVVLEYRSPIGGESLTLAQIPAVESPSVHDELARSDGWRQVTRNGVTVSVTKPGARHPAEAQIEHDGTMVCLESETLSAEQLITIAAGLRPAPSASDI